MGKELVGYWIWFEFAVLPYRLPLSDMLSLTLAATYDKKDIRHLRHNSHSHKRL
jgi:hypothetical protein